MSKDITESFRRPVDSTSFYQAVGEATRNSASPASPTAFGLVSARCGCSRRCGTERNAQGFANRQLQKRGFDGSFSNFKERRMSTHVLPQHAPAPAGRVASITVHLTPAPPRIQGGSATGTTIGTSQCT